MFILNRLHSDPILEGPILKGPILEGPILEGWSVPLAFQDIVSLSAEIAGRVIAQTPRIHCLTNTVAEPITANSLLALGAVPSMTSYGPELSEFLASSQGLVVNLGTPGDEKAHARRLAVAIAQEQSLPWILDPVMVDWSETRRQEAERLLAFGPRVVRGNAKEMTALRETLQGYQGVQTITGKIDRILQGARERAVYGGSPLLAQVTATGCALSAVIAAFNACHEDAFEASMAACIVFSAAGRLAATKASGPGSFAMHLVDALSIIDAETLHAHLPDPSSAPIQELGR